MTAAPQFRWQAVGRRKTSVARVYLTPGTGKWDINGRTLGDYFPRPSLVQHIQQSFTATDTLGAFDVKAHVSGGGQAGQAGVGTSQSLCASRLATRRLGPKSRKPFSLASAIRRRGAPPGGGRVRVNRRAGRPTGRRPRPGVRRRGRPGRATGRE